VGSNLHALRPDGTLLWSTTNVFSGASPIVGVHGEIYVSSLTRNLYAFNPNGIITWQSAQDGWSWCIYHAGCVIGTTPAVDAADRMYYCVHHGLTAFTTKRQIDWVFTYSGYGLPGTDYATTAAAICPDGTIYAVFSSTLYAFTGTNTLADSAWPAYRQNPRHTGSVEKPKLLEGHWLSDGRFEFRFYGHPGQRYAIQSSTDLNNWQGLTNVTVGTQPIWVSDPTAINTPTRFYRSVAMRGNP
jgi:outer membrane protein assembly factor BamB